MTSSGPTPPDWHTSLPPLVGQVVELRELQADDLGSLMDLLSIADASRFGLEEPVTAEQVQRFIARTLAERRLGLSFTYAVTKGPSPAVIGLFQVRQLEPLFDTAEWECTLATSVRGTGVFVEAARLVGAFAFGTVGTRRLETRVLLQNGRANAALRKLGAVEEGILRRAVRRGGEDLDQVLWSILYEDWHTHRAVRTPRVH